MFQGKYRYGKNVATGVPSASSGQALARPDRAKLGWGIAAVALIAVFAAGSYYRSHRSNRLTDKDSIVLADFDNKTGDNVFDDTLKQGLSVQLEQSPFFDLVSENKVNETLKLMGRPTGERLTPTEVTREVCQRTGSKAMLSGSIAGLGSQYVIGLKAVNCSTGDVLAEVQEQATNKEGVLKALDSAAVSLRGKLGESLNSVQKYATPLEKASTPSLEALQAYSLGAKAIAERDDNPGAVPLLQRAIRLAELIFGNQAGFALDYVLKIPPQTGVGDRYLDHHPVLGGIVDQDAADLPVSERRAPERGRHAGLSWRQCPSLGRLGAGHPGTGHQWRTGHALHGLGRHQCRRGHDPDHL